VAPVRSDLIAAASRTLPDLLQPARSPSLAPPPTRTADVRPAGAVGPQPERIGATRIWLVPNPAGLNAHYPPDRLAAEFARLAAELPAR
jgi:TDG/mug DNA glycosylase family protein